MSEENNAPTPLTVVEDETATDYSPQWGDTTRIIVTVLLITAGVYALTLLAPVFQVLAIAFLIGYLIHAGAEALANRTPLTYTLSVALLYLALAVFIVGLVIILIPPLVNGINNAVNRARTTFDAVLLDLEDYQPEDGIYGVMGFEVDLNPIIEPARALLLEVEQQAEEAIEEGNPAPFSISDVDTSQLEQLLQQVFNLAGTVSTTLTAIFSGVTGFLGTLFLAILISLFTLLDLPRTHKSIKRALTPGYQREYSLLMKDIEKVWDSFFRGSVLVSIIVTIATWIYLLLVGVPSAFVLAFVVGAFNLIPYISTVITLVILLVVPLATGSTVFTELSNVAFAGLVFVGYLPISAIIFNTIAPKIQGDAVNLPVSVVIVGVIIGSAIGGIMGAFLAAPLMGTIRVIVIYAVDKIAGRDPFPGREVIAITKILPVQESEAEPAPTSAN